MYRCHLTTSELPLTPDVHRPSYIGGCDNLSDQENGVFPV